MNRPHQSQRGWLVAAGPPLAEGRMLGMSSWPGGVGDLLSAGARQGRSLMVSDGFQSSNMNTTAWCGMSMGILCWLFHGLTAVTVGERHM